MAEKEIVKRSRLIYLSVSRYPFILIYVGYIRIYRTIQLEDFNDPFSDPFQRF